MKSNQSAVTLSGAPGSPYTRKMLAVLRYRRIPYRYLVNNHLKSGLPPAKPALLPTFYFPCEDGTMKAFTDSTPLIRTLETLFNDRQLLPPSPVMGMLDSLLEDYFDESDALASVDTGTGKQLSQLVRKLFYRSSWHKLNNNKC